MKASVLIIGGAGYIGSHVVRLLQQNGFKTVVYDNLSTGHKELVEGDFIFGDILDGEKLSSVFEEYDFDIIIHLAAKSIISESMQKPLMYYENNLSGTVNILKLMREYGVKRIIFSSTASVYGNPRKIPITENDEPKPDSVYGFSKLAIERMIADVSSVDGFSYVILRYFNAAGADFSGTIGELHIPETHLIPRVLDVAIGDSPYIEVFGTDYDTPDGTCIRDYVHVLDVAEIHMLALEWLLSDVEGGQIFNVGSGHGFSVLDIIEVARKITGKDIPIKESQRREGDPPKLIASPEKLKRFFGWEPKYSDPETIIRTAWNWHKGKRLEIVKKRKFIGEPL